jgi:hypothetical protein
MVTSQHSWPLSLRTEKILEKLDHRQSNKSAGPAGSLPLRGQRREYTGDTAFQKMSARVRSRNHSGVGSAAES